MVVQITADVARELMRKAVVEKGADYVYPQRDVGGAHALTTCVYVNADDSPSCLIGHALAYAGVPIQVLKDLDDGAGYSYGEDGEQVHDGGNAISDGFLYLADHGFYITPTAANMFIRAQGAQDSARTWGVSVAEAELAVS